MSAPSHRSSRRTRPPTRCGGRWPTGRGRVCSPRRHGSPRCAGRTGSRPESRIAVDASGAPSAASSGSRRRLPRQQAAQPALLRPGRPARPRHCRPGTCVRPSTAGPATRRSRCAASTTPPRSPASGCASSARPHGTARRFDAGPTSCIAGSPRRRAATSPRPPGGLAVEVRRRPRRGARHAPAARAAAQEQVPAARPADRVLRAHMAEFAPGRRLRHPAGPPRRPGHRRSGPVPGVGGRPLLQVRRVRSGAPERAPQRRDLLVRDPAGPLEREPRPRRLGPQRSATSRAWWGTSAMGQRATTARSPSGPASPSSSPPSASSATCWASLTRLLTEPSVPDEVTARAGALLYRYFC